MFNDARDWLWEKLQTYLPEQHGLTAYEPAYKHLFQHVLKNSERCLWRDDFNPGHMVSGILVANDDYSQVLLMHHPKLDKWLQFGGHLDGEGNAYVSALRELEEEAGITPDMIQGSGDIFDLDLQLIPARKDEPEHLHFETRFVVQLNDMNVPLVSPEGIEMKWFTLDEAEKVILDGTGSWRMIQKTKLLRDK